MTIPIYDLEKVYDEQISPLMTRIIGICREHQIPMVADFQYSNDEERGPGNCTTTLPFGERADEKIMRAISILRPQPPVAFAETHIQNPDGTKRIIIQRVS